jgi:hypothetical protein
VCKIRLLKLLSLSVCNCTSILLLSKSANVYLVRPSSICHYSLSTLADPDFHSPDSLCSLSNPCPCLFGFIGEFLTFLPSLFPFALHVSTLVSAIHVSWILLSRFGLLWITFLSFVIDSFCNNLKNISSTFPLKFLSMI